jgi:radical SAM superfamily enzyme YgiQ (UPF0313 family)
MLTLVNTNRMLPLIGPIGLEYVGGSARQAGIDVELLDLALTEESVESMREYFSTRSPELVGVSFRNVDDCFWPSADWFVPGLKDTIETIRSMTGAPIVVGGVGFSIFAENVIEYTSADFGIRGDGEAAMISLIHQLRGSKNFKEVPGLVWREEGRICCNPPSWSNPISLATARDFIDNPSYFRQGGQCGLETKRGCDRNCIYCADPLAKGNKLRLRNPSEVADEVQSLLSQGVDVLHFCDSEFNVPRGHAYAICEEFNRRSLGKRVRWYTYMLPIPFDEELAGEMSRAGCVGIDFTGDSACPSMLKTYRQQHRKENLASSVMLCRKYNIAVMIDLLLGGPGETPQTAKETIDFIKKINPDCAGAALGVRIYPDTMMGEIAARELSENEGSIRRKYPGPIDFFRPTFYISKALGEQPAKLVRDMIGDDRRFFAPADQADCQVSANGDTAANYNYNENQLLVQAIQKGARGAYWDILRRIRW